MIKVTCDACHKEIQLDDAYNICVAKFSSQTSASTNIIRQDLCPECWGKVAEVLGLIAADDSHLYYCNGCDYFKTDDKYCCLGYPQPRSDCHSKSHNAYRHKRPSREADLAGIDSALRRTCREADVRVIRKMVEVQTSPENKFFDKENTDK